MEAYSSSVRKAMREIIKTEHSGYINIYDTERIGDDNDIPVEMTLKIYERKVRMVIEVSELQHIDETHTIVRMAIPNDEWERIKSSEEWSEIIGSNVCSRNQFKSIHIDLEKKIFMLNGKPLDNVTNLRLEACGTEWSLELSREERYEAPFRKSE